MLHSLLVIEGKTAHLEAVVSEPPLMVNGEARRSVELHDEDTVVIGEFEFVFHRLIAVEPAGQVAVASPITEEEACGVADLSQLSAVELVSLIEEEARQITEYNRSREQGAASLLDAARRASAATRPASFPIATFAPEKTGPLRQPSERLAKREAECLRQAAELMAAQERLAAQMAEFAAQVAHWQESEDRTVLRASA